MKNTIIISLFSIVISALTIYFPKTMINPGDVVKGHKSISNDCFACHSSFKGIESNKCIQCHKLNEIDNKISTNKVRFHEKLKEQNCVSCHLDHEGENPTVKISFFDHKLLPASELNQCINCHNQPSDNKHQLFPKDCKSCHSTSNWKSAKEFDHEIITSNDCKVCHKSPDDVLHNGIINQCSKCHSTNKWKPATFEHSKYFKLDQEHNVKCDGCHKDNSNFSTYTCYGCHEHTENNIRNEHLEEGIKDFKNCVSCHKGSSEHDLQYESKKSESEKNFEEDDD